MILRRTTAATIFATVALSTFAFSMLLGLAASNCQAAIQRVQLTPASPGAFKAGNFSYSFQLIDSKTNHSITDKDLAIENEKILHLFLFDPSLIEFRHLHPIFNGSSWTVDAELGVNGNYWVWAQGKLSSDQTDFTTSNRLKVEGGLPENPVSELEETRTGENSGSIVQLSDETFQSNQMAMPMLNFSRADGSQPQVSDYLGAKAHVVIVPSTGDSLIHVHPMQAETNQLMIHTEFPHAGKYRVWVQFIDGGDLKVVPLAISVGE